MACMKAADLRLIDSGAGSAWFNMALDEALLINASNGDSPPTLRFFSWDIPSLSIGSFQRVEELDLDEIKARGIPLVRRPTGGRAVLHDEELTYSFICPIPSPLFPSDLMGSYKRIGECFIEGLRQIGIHATLVPVTKNPARKTAKINTRDPLCFSSPSWHEVLADGKKLIGSAQRRLRTAFLQQGSLIIYHDPAGLAGLLRSSRPESRQYAEESLRQKMTTLSELGIKKRFDELKDAIARGFGLVLGLDVIPGSPSAAEMELARRLYSEKYSSDGWNLHRQSLKDLA
jgi:lipoyl(octanoyl) transferase